MRVTSDEMVWWPVSVQRAKGDGTNRYDRFTVKMRFLLPGNEEQLAIADEDLSLPVKERLQNTIHNLSRYILDWEGLEDADGNPLACTEEHKQFVLNKQYILNAVLKALQHANGNAREKN